MRNPDSVQRQQPGNFDQVSVKGEESVTAGAEDKEKNIAMTDAQTKSEPDAEETPEDDSYETSETNGTWVRRPLQRHLIL